MIYPQKNILVHGFFRLYIPWIIRRNFKVVNFNSIAVDQNKSVLLVANHFSWWDAFLLYFVFDKLSDKNFYVMVTEGTMNEHWFFKYIGAFSVSKSPHEVIKSLEFATALLADPENLVLIFPQGKLYSNFIDKVDFERGVMEIIGHAAGKFQLVYAATFIENFQHKKPTVNVYLTAETNSTFENIYDLASSYQQHYNQARLQQIKTIL